MGELIDGQWVKTGIESVIVNGTLKRPSTIFRDWITAEDDDSGAGRVFKAEPGRYHLYVSFACPWAHRTLIIRALKGLEEIVSVSVVHWLMLEDGWTFAPGPGVVPDHVNGVFKLHEIYTLADPHCTSRVSVPVLWDKKTKTIVSNESSEIIRMFNSAFDAIGASGGDYYPVTLRDEIDAINTRVYETLNNGVYKAGFATTQETYEVSVDALFETLDWLEDLLTRQPYLAGGRMTEADIRLFVTLVRFDAVYHGHFKCNRHKLIEYPALYDHTRRLYRERDIRPTVYFQHIKGHYYGSHLQLNPTGIVPVGPDLTFGRLDGHRPCLAQGA